MKKIVVASMVAMIGLVGCADSKKGDTAGDNYNVNVNNAGNGDVVVNTGAGTVMVNQKGQCVVVLDINTTRPCTQKELGTTLNRVQNAFIFL